MSEILEQRAVESPEHSELLELGRIAGELCQHIERLIRDENSPGNLASRESDLQLEVFEERREEVVRLLTSGASGSIETRATRLERLVKALECSLAYFHRTETDTLRLEAQS